MDIRKRFCCFCEKELKPNGTNHVYGCKLNENLNLERSEIKLKYLEYNFYDLFDKKLLEDLYNEQLWSLPDFKEKYGIDFKSMGFILNHFGIKLRTIKESTNLKKTRDKYKKTCEKIYGEGITNVGLAPEVIEKRTNTLIKRYGVDNIYKNQDFIKNHSLNDAIYMERYGKTRKEYFSDVMKKLWSDPIQREKWLNSSSFFKGGSSKQELTLGDSLERLKYKFTTQFTIIQKRFDFAINKLLIEYNGDYWHANPKIYKKGDIINYPGRKGTHVEEVWLYDGLKKAIAEEKGYQVLYIWERDWMRLKTNEKRDSFLSEKIKECLNASSKN